jgi:hypothetical protein
LSIARRDVFLVFRLPLLFCIYVGLGFGWLQVSRGARWGMPNARTFGFGRAHKKGLLVEMFWHMTERTGGALNL